MTVKKRSIRLKNSRDVQRFLTRICNERYREELEGDVARDVGYLLKILLDSLKGIDLEERIEAIEKKLTENKLSER